MTSEEVCERTSTYSAFQVPLRFTWVGQEARE